MACVDMLAAWLCHVGTGAATLKVSSRRAAIIKYIRSCWNSGVLYFIYGRLYFIMAWHGMLCGMVGTAQHSMVWHVW
jgi:hypothetical protein